MKKINIIKESKDFDNIFKLRKQISSKYAYLYIGKTNSKYYRFGICVSKKVGNAVIRNKVKRKVKDIIDKSGLHFSSKDYIIVVKKSAACTQYFELKEDLLKLLRNINE